MTSESLTLAAAHHQAGRLDQAETLYRKAISEKPNDPQALHLLGTLLFQTARAREALPPLERAASIDPRRADFQLNLAVVLLALSRPAEAAAACRRAIAIRSDWSQAWFNLGCALGAMTDWKGAISAYRSAIQYNKDDAGSYYNLADAYRATGDWDGAVENFRKTAAIGPHPQALNNLAGALERQGKTEEAIEIYRQAIAIKPDFAEAFSNLGNSLSIAARFHESAAACTGAISLRPDFAEAYSNLGNALLGMNHIPEAIDSFRRAENYPPAADNLLWALHFLPDPDPAQIFAEHQKWNDRFAKPLATQINPYDVDRDPNRRLRVGYVSPDFREHSVGFFIESLLAGHDRNQVETFAYADLLKGDATTARLKKLVHHWRDTTGVTDQNLSDMIRADKIDILVDLAGHTAGNRLLVFARKPAPVQFTYLGCPDTTGLSVMDYRLTDFHADPPGMTEGYYSEKLLRLPHSFVCYQPPSDAPEVSPQPAKRNGFITFGSFNNLAKMNQKVTDLWIRILQSVPNSRLLIKNAGLSDSEARAEFLHRFTSVGINPARIDLRGKSPSIHQHLQTYAEMDIALDTYPYNGTTTTCEAIWMGVPVVTLTGKTHASRVGLSLLTNLGLAELAAGSEDEYVKKAAAMTGLEELRPSLREKMRASRLLDARAFAADVESAFRRAWQEGISR